jgi:hypothetical protein
VARRGLLFLEVIPSMRTSEGLLIATFILGLAGCGAGSGPTTPAATHGGSLEALSNGAGYIEFLAVGDAASKAGGPRSKTPTSRVVTYFINTDGSGLPSPAPTEVTFTDVAGKSHKLVSKAGGDAGSLMFETEQPALVGHDVLGSFDVKIGADTIKVPVRPR